jgi:cytidylate kinase
MPRELCIYVTGLPGAGKSTIGSYVSDLLSIPLLDKDDYLEALFESRGVGDSNWRHKLSREADQLFMSDAESKSKAVLVSHWRPKDASVHYGTPSDWLLSTFHDVIEIYCKCSVSVAANRFINRNRHMGHVDQSRSGTEIQAWLNEYAAFLPIGFGRCISVNSVNEEWKNEINNLFKKYL